MLGSGATAPAPALPPRTAKPRGDVVHRQGRRDRFLRPSIAVIVARSGAAEAAITTWAPGEKIAGRQDRPAAARIREAIRRAETYHRSVRLQRYKDNLPQEPKIKLDVARRDSRAETKDW
jgi:hypothetical protein